VPDRGRGARLRHDRGGGTGADKATKAPHGSVGALGAGRGDMQAEGVLVRALGDTLAVCPPLITTEADVDTIVDAFHSAIQAATRELFPGTGPA
jgi:4-aminobutyrate---pyruvate transaminase